MAAAPGANTMRWPVVAAAMSDPPPAGARNCSSDAGGHDDDVAGPVGAPELRSRRGRPRPSGWRCGCAAGRARAAQAHQRDRAAVGEVWRRSRRRWASRTGAGEAGGAAGPPTSVTATIRLGDQQQAQQETTSTGGCCGSAHCPPEPLAPACHRWTRAPSSRRRCRCAACEAVGVVRDDVTRLHLRHVNGWPPGPGPGWSGGSANTRPAGRPHHQPEQSNAFGPDHPHE